MINFGTDDAKVVGKYLEKKVTEITEEISNVTVYILIFDENKKALSAGFGCKACIGEALKLDAARYVNEPHNKDRPRVH